MKIKNKLETLKKVDPAEEMLTEAIDKHLDIFLAINKLKNLQRTKTSLMDDTWCAIKTEDGYPLVEINLWFNDEHPDFPIWLMIIYDETVLIHHNVAQQSVAETMSIVQNTLTACEHLKAAHDVVGNYEMGRDN